MTYFRELPNLQYQSFLKDRKSSNDYLLVKNIFRRVKLRDDLQNVFTIFNKYQIADGARPEIVAEEIYGNVQYDWVVLITAGITNVRDQWPLSDRQIYQYSEEIYGEEMNDIHHYETTEVKDSQGRLILPAGKVVDQDFTICYQDGEVIYTNDSSALGENIFYIPDPVVGVTNYEYEVVENNKKRSIYVLKPRYLQQVLLDTRKEMTYDRSSQYLDDKTIRTENTRITSP